jgi:hypothetical protein
MSLASCKGVLGGIAHAVLGNHAEAIAYDLGMAQVRIVPLGPSATRLNYCPTTGLLGSRQPAAGDSHFRPFRDGARQPKICPNCIDAPSLTCLWVRDRPGPGAGEDGVDFLKIGSESPKSAVGAVRGQG